MYCLITGIGRSSPLILTMISRRASASRVSFAWIVVSEPSCPVFIACNISSASGPRTSPIRIRSGRIRRALRIRSRCTNSPRPSVLAGRVSMRTTCRFCSCSSAESSMVTMRSPSGILKLRAFSSVVLPAPVPPEIRKLTRASTAAARKSVIAWLIEPRSSKS